MRIGQAVAGPSGQSLCSRNARPEKALVGRAQWKINQPPSLEGNEQAWKEHVYCSTRAREVAPFHPVTRWEKGRAGENGARSGD